MAVTSGTLSGHYNLMEAFNTFVTGTCGWTSNRHVNTGTDYEYIWHAPGLSGGKAIYTGVKTYQDISADYYNIKVNGFTGYTALNTFETQPGRISTDLGVPLYNQNIPYIFVGNGQRAIAVFNVSNQWESFHLGFFLPYATPSQWPYPLLTGGMFPNAAALKYSDVNQSSWWKGSLVNCAMRFTDGNWRNPQILPFPGANTLRNTNSDSTVADGYYAPIPLILSEVAAGYVNNYGEIDGLYYITGFQNAVGNTVTISGTDYFVVRDVGRTGNKDFVALKLA